MKDRFALEGATQSAPCRLFELTQRLKSSSKVLTAIKNDKPVKRPKSAVRNKHLVGVRRYRKPVTRQVEPIPVSTIMKKKADRTFCLSESPNAWGYLVINYDSIIPLDKQLDNRLASEAAGYVVGNDENCDIRVKHRFSEARHAFIHCRMRSKIGICTQAVYLYNQCSNGTWINNKRIQNEVVELNHNDHIYFMDPAKYDIKENPCYTFIKPHLTTTKYDDIYHLYHIEKRIGRGAFGEVFLATCKKTKQNVAMKIIKSEALNNKRLKSTLLREISVCMSFPVHPCIIQVDRVFERDECTYIIMEYGVDGDLFDSVTSCEYTLQEHDVRIIFDQIAHAISFLHKQGIVHRDIKLENVIMCDRKKLTVKLCDFGLSTFFKQGKALSTSCGTIMYAAPELLEAEKGYGMEVDIWSLGVLLFTALATSTPFAQVDEEETKEDRERLKDQIRKGEFDFTNPVWATISEEAKDLIERMMMVDKRYRYNIRQVLDHPWLKNIENVNTLKSGLRRNPELVSYLKENRTRSSIL